MPSNAHSAAPRWHSFWRLFVDIRPSEVRGTLILTVNFFLLFSAYYVLKPIREGLILSMNGGAELKSSATMIQAVAFMALVPLYSRFADRFSGRGILIGIYLFMAANVLALMGIGLCGYRYLGVVYFIWLGFFNMLAISQTWSLCAELYDPSSGKRLFALIALGAAAGATFGSLILRSVVPHIGLFKPMIIAAILLTSCAVLIWASVPRRPAIGRRNGGAPKTEEGEKDLLGGIAMVFRNRYVTLIAFLILITNLINTNSEYMLGNLVAAHYKAAIGGAGPDRVAALQAAIGSFYARFYLWVNVAVLVTQALAVSRIIKHVGVASSLFIAPVLSLCSYLAVLFLPLLFVVRFIKIVENTTDYSLNNTVREVLYLPLSTKEKYKAKLAADTIFRRMGDALSKPMVFVVVELLGFGVSFFSGLNVLLVLVWIWLVWRIRGKRMEMDRIPSDGLE